MKKILVVDDEIGTRESLTEIFWDTHQVLTAESAADAFKILKQTQIDLLLLDIILPGKDGMEFLKEVRSIYPDLPVIMVSAVTSTSTTAEAVRLGAVDFITKPFDVADVRTIAERSLACADLRRRYEAARRETLLESPSQNMVGESPAFRIVMRQARKLSMEDSHFAVVGEHGTGVEMLARYVHSLSSRGSQPFISIHCASLSEAMLEAELFGKHNSSAPSHQLDSLGILDLASSGTLLFKEIHILSREFQKKLNQVLETKTFRRPNGSQNIKTNVRIILTSSTDIDSESFAAGSISQLIRNALVMPALRDRKEDIPLLVHYFLNYFRQRKNIAMADIDSRAMELLRSYSWPGNVKELQNVIERILVVHGDKACLRSDFLPFEIQAHSDPSVRWPKLQGTLEDSVNAFQKELISKALEQARGQPTHAAKLLGTTPRILNYRIKQLKIPKLSETNA